ncbi:uncharacterized protein LOC117176682 [Belonocnema kinseyi]|uniref:uncharacterized protein LOC117176682 n=1 Tax=Belonocnema kinseyi TaxID=2817044 RepID=UPI00143D90EE|nr:uncharacterized protein LOC117176682 [Belonocnema kinseyi]
MAITFTPEQFQELLQNIKASLRFEGAHPAAQPGAATPHQGNFSKCLSRFDGNKDTEVNAFIDAIQIYKECTNISDENALKGITMLFNGFAATWCQGVKSSLNTREEVKTLLKSTFSVKQSAYRVYRELFAGEQDEHISTDLFICKARALLAHLPENTVTEAVQVDMIYGLLLHRIRKEVPREKVNNLKKLIELARKVEENHMESLEKKATTSNSISSKPNSKKCKFCKVFGHATDECRRFKKKLEKESDSVKNENISDAKSSENTKLATQPSTNPTIKCFGCDTPGYVRRNCPKCNKNAEIKTASTNLESCTLDCTEKETRTRSRPKVPIKILGSHGTGFLDSCAGNSVSGYSLYQLLIKKGQEFEKVSVKVGFADGEKSNREILIAELKVTLMDKEIPTTVIIFPEAQNSVTLLGIDFLEDAEIIINAPQRVWKFLGDSTEHELQYGNISATMDNVQVSFVNTMRSDEGSSLTEDQRIEIEKFLSDNEDVFAVGGEPTPYAEHRIDTGDHIPVATPPNKMSTQKKELLYKELTSMQENDIEECESPWAAQVVLIPKKDSGVRVCLDYRRLNAITTSDKYPMSRIEEFLHNAKRTYYMYTIDLRNGY